MKLVGLGLILSSRDGLTTELRCQRSSQTDADAGTRRASASAPPRPLPRACPLESPFHSLPSERHRARDFGLSPASLSSDPSSAAVS